MRESPAPRALIIQSAIPNKEKLLYSYVFIIMQGLITIQCPNPGLALAVACVNEGSRQDRHLHKT